MAPSTGTFGRLPGRLEGGGVRAVMRTRTTYFYNQGARLRYYPTLFMDRVAGLLRVVVRGGQKEKSTGSRLPSIRPLCVLETRLHKTSSSAGAITDRKSTRLNSS